MAIALDTSPALVVRTSSGATIVTAAFSPGVNTLLVASVMVGVASGTLTVSGGSLTWTRRVTITASSCYSEIWTAPCVAGAAGITVTVTGSGSIVGGALKTDVYTGANLATPVGATGSGASTTNNVTVSAYTSTAFDSRGVAASVDTNALGAPTSTDDESAFDVPGIVSGMAIRKAANSGASGSGVTFNLDAFGTGTPDWNWVAVEIMPDVAAFLPAPPMIVNQAALQRAANY